jgi:hypothetical protein
MSIFNIRERSLGGGEKINEKLQKHIFYLKQVGWMKIINIS